MSQNLGYHSEILNQLIAYSKGILKGDPGLDLYSQYRDVIPFVTPKDIITIVDELVKTNSDTQQVKRAVNKILNIFYEPIKGHGRVLIEGGTFLYYLMEENRALEIRLKKLKEVSKKVFGQKDTKAALLDHREAILEILIGLKEYEKHFTKIENILFPYFEKAFTDFRCAGVMWSMHDDARNSLGNLIQNLEAVNPSVNKFNFEIGRFYFSVLPVIFREEYILFPECNKLIEEEAWEDMLEQSREIGYAYFEIQDDPTHAIQKIKAEIHGSVINLETGSLEVDRIIYLFNHLPVDMTYVDENDEVKYFSNPKDRIFPRSKAIIGRKVQNCHPPESIETVNQIVDAFRNGKKDSESFWINIKGKLILIQYFAVRDANGIYKGALEVSQDITEIRKLEGEKRIVDLGIR
jgi:PAS domain S-box-containing protein